MLPLEMGSCDGRRRCDRLSVPTAAAIVQTFPHFRNLRASALPVWIEAARRAGVERVLQQSIALVNATDSDRWSDEDTPVAGVQSDVKNGRAREALGWEPFYRNYRAGLVR
jgi:hypothetical protein